MKTKLLISMLVAVLATGPAVAQGKSGGKASPRGDERGDERVAPGLDQRSKGLDREPSDSPGEPKRIRPADSADTERLESKSSTKGKSERSASAAAQGLAGSMQDINQTAFAQRRELHENLDMRLESSRQALKQIQADAKASRADARAEFKSALNEVKARERELKDSMKASRKADEANWEERRSALGRATQKHLEALNRLEAVARGPQP